MIDMQSVILMASVAFLLATLLIFDFFNPFK